jgi:tetratricopeptide (TPR) repeat protein
VIKIDENTKGVAMFDGAQWFLAGMSMALSVQLSQPVAAAVPLGKAVQTAQTNSNEAAKKVFEEAEKLNQQGTADSKRKAIVKWEEALKLYREAGDRLREAATLHNIGAIYSELGEQQKALEYYSQSLPLSQAVGDRSWEALTLYCMAYAKRDQNNLTEALNDIESSLKIIENLRTNIASPELRSSYLATVQEYYEFYIDLLMQLHKTNPNSGYDIKASEASERAKTP